MAPKQAKKMAEDFLRAQAKIIQQYGTAPKLSGDHYRQVVTDTQRAFTSLKSAALKLK